MNKRLEKIVPPGYGAENILALWCLGSIICVMIAMGFMLDFERDLRFSGRIDDFAEYFGDERISYLTYGHIRERCFTFLALGLLAFAPCTTVTISGKAKAFTPCAAWGSLWSCISGHGSCRCG